MGKKDIDRLRYWSTRKVWSIRMPLGDGRYERRTFGPTGVAEDDREAHAQAVLECSMWLGKRNEKLDIEAHYKAISKAREDEAEGLRMMTEAARRYKAGELPREAALAAAGRGIEQDAEASEELRRLSQPQLRLLNRIRELEPLADRALELDKENKTLRAEVETLKSLLAASGRAAATENGPLSKLVEQFITAHAAKLRAKGTSDKTMTPIRSSSRAVVEFCRSYSPTIETSADLDATPRVLADYRDSIMEQLEEKSSGWARKQLDGPRHFAEWLVARGYLGSMPRSITRDWLAVGKDDPHPTYLTVEEIRTLVKNAPDDEIRVAVLLGVNAAYRESDLVSLRATDIDIKSRIIKRTRNKTGALQVHRLWASTAEVLELWLAEKHDGYPLAHLRGISKYLTAYIDEQLEGNADLGDERRTAKSLRCTAAQLVEQVTKGEQPHLVSQMLGHADASMAKHYRRANFDGLFKVIDQIEDRLGV